MRRFFHFKINLYWYALYIFPFWWTMDYTAEGWSLGPLTLIKI